MVEITGVTTMIYFLNWMCMSNFVFGTFVVYCLCFQHFLSFCLTRPAWRNIVTFNFNFHSFLQNKGHYRIIKSIKISFSKVSKLVASLLCPGFQIAKAEQKYLLKKIYLQSLFLQKIDFFSSSTLQKV